VSKIGISLGSGGARGWALIGVIRELEEAGIKVDVAAGTSMGAIVGSFYALGRLDELEKFGRALTNKRVMSLMDITFTGHSFFSGKRLMAEVTKALNGAKFADCRIPMGIVATQMGSGHSCWFREGELGRAVMASSALPGVLDPVKINGKWHIDGALVDPVPVTIARAMGADVVIAVSMVSDVLHRSRQLQNIVEGGDSEFAVERAIDTSLMRFLPKFKKDEDRPPPVSAIMTSALDVMLDRIRRSKLAGDPPDIHINVVTDGWSMFDFHCAGELIEQGRRAARTTMPMILETLGLACPAGIAVKESFNEQN